MTTNEQRLDDLEAANALLSVKVATMEPRLCCCGREEQPIIIEDGEVINSSPSSYQTPPVVSRDKNQEPIPVRIVTMREGQLIPVVEQEEINKLFQDIDREREAITTIERSCQYVLLIVSGGGFGSGIVLNFTRCQQQSTSSLGSRSDNSMGLRGLFGTIDPFECVSTLTMSTTSLERRSIERNVESTVATTPRLNLDCIASQTMTRLRQVSIPFPVLNYTWGRTWRGQKQVSEDQKAPSFHRGNSDTSI